MQEPIASRQGGSFATATTKDLYKGCAVVTEVTVAHNTKPEPVALGLLVAELNRRISPYELEQIADRAGQEIDKLSRHVELAPLETRSALATDLSRDLPRIFTGWEAGKASIEVLFDVEHGPMRVVVRVTASGTEDLRLLLSALLIELLTTFELDFTEARTKLLSPDARRSCPGAKGSPLHEAELDVGHGRTATVAVSPRSPS